MLALLLALPAQAGDWRATERIDHYTIDGRTGIALYKSIGARGPRIGPTRAIAHTTWDLKWRRNYVRQGDACRLTGVKPFLTIIYTLPKARGRLPGPLAAKWKRFSAGIADHEKVHGDLLRVMVDEIIRDTSELVVEGDPNCRAIRAEVKKRVFAAHGRYKQASRAFDRREMAAGGNVHRLVLGLVN